MRCAFYMLFFSVLAFSCNDAEIGSTRDVSPEAIYFDYKITAEEGRDMVTCLFQYKFGGSDGTTLLLEEPSKVELDGQEIKADSTPFTGVYYEIEQPVNIFTGKHTIAFTGPEGKQYKEQFEFTPFSLLTDLPAMVPRKPFSIKLKDIPQQETPVRLVMIDTSFDSPDVNDIITVKNAEIKIDEAMLGKIKNGPIMLEISLEKIRPVQQGTKEGGNLSLTYTLKREFELHN